MSGYSRHTIGMLALPSTLRTRQRSSLLANGMSSRGSSVLSTTATSSLKKLTAWSRAEAGVGEWRTLAPRCSVGGLLALRHRTRDENRLAGRIAHPDGSPPPRFESTRSRESSPQWRPDIKRRVEHQVVVRMTLHDLRVDSLLDGVERDAVVVDCARSQPLGKVREQLLHLKAQVVPVVGRLRFKEHVGHTVTSDTAAPFLLGFHLVVNPQQGAKISGDVIAVNSLLDELVRFAMEDGGKRCAVRCRDACRCEVCLVGDGNFGVFYEPDAFNKRVLDVDARLPSWRAPCPPM